VPFLERWDAVPIVFLDVETTGLRPGVDRVVEVGIARFVDRRLAAQWGSLIDPGIPIPPEVTAIHGIRDEDVRGKPTLDEFIDSAETKAILAGAQPAAYNGPFDKWFIPPRALQDWTWPWLDTLTLVRSVDRYARGPGRHKLGAACDRHDIRLDSAHRASDDARAAGELLFVLMDRVFPEYDQPSIGELLGWMRRREATQWVDFHSWLAKQPPREASSDARSDWPTSARGVHPLVSGANEDAGSLIAADERAVNPGDDHS
jgi:DNA polymerase-3 subunit epsilon